MPNTRLDLEPRVAVRGSARLTVQGLLLGTARGDSALSGMEREYIRDR